MCQAHRQTAQCEQMQHGHQSQGINVQGWAEPGLRTIACWWGHRCHFVADRRHHKLISWTRERASFRLSLPYSVKLGSAMSVSDREADENSLFTGETPSIDTDDIMALSDTSI